MATVATAAPRAAIARPPRAARPALRTVEPGEVTLEVRILGVWEDLVADGRAECPVCGGALHAAAGCDGCGSRLD